MTRRSLPNFLGIGAQRSGTSWLYFLLKSHPEIFVPPHVKEVHFFDRHYDRGLHWYESFFSSEGVKGSHKARGEISPNYLFDEAVPARVREHLPHAKFIVLLRNPVNRAYSTFRNVHFKGLTKTESFAHFVQDTPSVFMRGMYAAQIRRWLDHFPRDRFLVLIFEEIFRDPVEATQSIASFLGVAPQGFDKEALEQKVNPSNAPKVPALYQFGIRIRRYLQRKDFHRAGSLLEKVGSRFFRLLGESKRRVPELNKTEKRRLLDAYAQDIEELETILKRDLSVWQEDK